MLVIVIFGCFSLYQYRNNNQSGGIKGIATNALSVRIGPSYIAPGGSYAVWVTRDTQRNGMYTGNLEVSYRYCDSNCSLDTSWKSVQSIWMNFDKTPVYINNGYFKATIPTDFPKRATYMKFRPSPNTEGFDWSNEVQQNVGTTYNLANTRDYFIFWSSPKTFHGKNYAFTLANPNGDKNPKTFTTVIGYYPPVSDICGTGAGHVMYIYKDNPYGYWNPATPWYNDYFSHNPNWSGDPSKWNYRWLLDVKQYFTDWKKSSGWNDTYLTMPGFKTYNYLTSPNFSTITYSGRTGGVANGFPNYGKLPEYLGPGWAAGMNQAQNTILDGDVMCDLYTGNGEGIWSIKADFLPLNTKQGVVTALRVRELEGDRNYLSGGNFLREDYWLIKGQGIVRIDVKQFGSNPGDGRLTCQDDPDCLANDVIQSPHVTLMSEGWEPAVSINVSPTPTRTPTPTKTPITIFTNTPTPTPTTTPRTITPSCTGARPTGNPTIPYSQTSYTVYADGVIGASKVTFWVWSEFNGQDDLIGYPGTNTGGGTWKATFNPQNHKSTGQFQADVWMNDWIKFCKGAPFIRAASTTPTPTGTDTTSPYRSGGAPSGNIYHLTSVDVTINTNENATCKFSKTALTPYNSQQYTFTSTGGKAHKYTQTSLVNGGYYKYYVRCKDTVGNVNDTDYKISYTYYK